MLGLPESIEMRAERGFTLLEILAALAIAVVGIAAVAKATSSTVDVVQTTENRVLASWVASNRLAELRIGRAWPSPITRDLSQDLGGRVWYYSEKISGTADPDLIRVDLSIYSDQEHQHLVATLFGYLARYSPPTEPPLEPDESEQPETEQGADEAVGANDTDNVDTSQEQASDNVQQETTQ